MDDKKSMTNRVIVDRSLILDKLKIYLSEDRYSHTLGVEETAVKMAHKFGVDESKASLSALLHDCAKEFKKEEIINIANKIGWPVTKWELAQPGELLHAPVSAHLAVKEFGISNEEILKAITYHTLGNEDMSPLDMIIFVADMVEPNRSFPGVETLRQIAYDDLTKAVLACLEHTLKYLSDKNVEIHPQTSRTYLSLKGKVGKGNI